MICGLYFKNLLTSPEDLRLMVYRFAFADFRAEFGQHGNEEVESFPAKDKASGKQECLLLLFPAKVSSVGTVTFADQSLTYIFVEVVQGA
jgi:hypothetical protein